MGRFKTPVGSFDSREDAIDACAERGLDPTTSIETRADFMDVSWETASYGLPIKLSMAVRVF